MMEYIGKCKAEGESSDTDLTDNGCSRHMIGEKSYLVELKP